MAVDASVADAVLVDTVDTAVLVDTVDAAVLVDTVDADAVGFCTAPGFADPGSI